MGFSRNEILKSKHYLSKNNPMPHLSHYIHCVLNQLKYVTQVSPTLRC